MFGIVQIQAGQFVERNAVCKLRVGGTRQHIHLVTELFESAAEVLYVNPLPPAGRISAIGQQTDPESAFGVSSFNGIGSRLFQREFPLPMRTIFAACDRHSANCWMG